MVPKDLQINKINTPIYQCNEGFSIDADAKGNKTFPMSCQSSGTFYKDPAKQKCMPVNCGKPKEVENGKHEDREYVYTQLATYDCVYFVSVDYDSIMANTRQIFFDGGRGGSGGRGSRDRCGAAPPRSPFKIGVASPSLELSVHFFASRTFSKF